MIFNKNFRFMDEIYVLSQFFIFMQLNDITGNFRGDAKKIVELLNEYLKKQAVYQEILKSSRQLVCANTDLSKENLSKFDAYLEDVFSEFIESLKQTDNFNETKHNYFE